MELDDDDALRFDRFIVQQCGLVFPFTDGTDDRWDEGRWPIHRLDSFDMPILRHGSFDANRITGANLNR